MTLVYACIAPHGGELVPELTKDKGGRYTALRKGMETIASRAKSAKPETIVIASPHNLRLAKHIGIVLSENTSGTVTEKDGSISLDAKCDLNLGMRVLSRAEKAGLPVVGANYGALEGPSSNLAMDWGSLIPLWFLARRGGSQRVLIVTPSRGIPLRQNFEFGRVIARVAESTKRRVAFVASADQAHTHSKDGPYGFSRAAAEYDRLVIDSIKRDRLYSILSFDQQFVDDAKPDSLWQMTMLAGVLDVVPMKGELIAYDVPSYFGMLCASYNLPARISKALP
jgi:aromatic ring-opening dioxygenase LigB subunit